MREAVFPSGPEMSRTKSRREKSESWRSHEYWTMIGTLKAINTYLLCPMFPAALFKLLNSLGIESVIGAWGSNYACKRTK